MLERITVMNRNEAVRHTRRRHVDDKAAMVSIESSDRAYTSFPRPSSHVPLINTTIFDDIMPGEDGHLITDGQAAHIAKFIKRINELGFTHLIVHCDEGISRSAAVAKAAAEAFGIPDIAVRHNRTPNPNMHVYGLMKQTLS